MEKIIQKIKNNYNLFDSIIKKVNYNLDKSEISISIECSKDKNWLDLEISLAKVKSFIFIENRTSNSVISDYELEAYDNLVHFNLSPNSSIRGESELENSNFYVISESISYREI